MRKVLTLNARLPLSESIQTLSKLKSSLVTGDYAVGVVSSDRSAVAMKTQFDFHHIVVVEGRSKVGRQPHYTRLPTKGT